MNTEHLLLAPNERRWRALGLVLLPAMLWLLRMVPPAGLPRWLPFHTSCGAITGLPCIFCGLTRALHFLLQGDLARALYFNWLAFPLFAAAILLLVFLGVEVATGRIVIKRPSSFHLTRGSICGSLAGLLLLWFLQVYLAVSQHKQELFNPAGPLYSLVMR